ncbi:MAG: hypothetical protein RLY58_666 [Pseudomonadota bacterium]|jgi:hypothetical protein
MIPTPPTNAHILAQQLLDAQVRYAKERLAGEHAIDIMTHAMDEILARAEHFQLNEVVSAQAIRDVVTTYAFELNLGGGVLELIGAMARQLHHQFSQNAPALKHLMTDRSILQWIEKIIELEPLRQQLAQHVLSSQTVHRMLSQMLTLMLRRQFPQWMQQLHEQMEQRANRPHRFAGLFNRLAQQEDQLNEWLIEQLVQRIQNTSSHLLSLDDVELRDLLNQFWLAIRELKLDYFAEALDPLDVEEFFVLVYDDWRRLRQHSFVQDLILTGVDVFFDIYGEYTLVELIDEVGITRQHMIGEIIRFAPPVIAALKHSGDLDSLLRLQLEPFYHQPETLALLSDALDANRSSP